MADTEGITSKTECAEETLEEDKQPECAEETVEDDKESTSEDEDTEITDTEEEETVHTYPSRYRKLTVKAKTSADLEKIKTLKAIEIARAKLETLDEIDGTDNASVLKDMKIIKSEFHVYMKECEVQGDENSRTCVC
uniref:Uncharacterized protein n=1 Tax=Magallana gigas TaxID=29159 RepID=K1PNT2_MAGGI